jgi:hypothetical protein
MYGDHSFLKPSEMCSKNPIDVENSIHQIKKLSRRGTVSVDKIQEHKQRLHEQIISGDESNDDDDDEMLP